MDVGAAGGGPMRLAVYRVKCKSCKAEISRYGFRFCPDCLRHREGTGVRVLAHPGAFPEPLGKTQPARATAGDGQTYLGDFR